MPDAASRRDFLVHALAGAPAAGLAAHPADRAGQPPAASRLSIVCVGAHPDDPESGAGGVLARYAQAGHSVTIVYLTRGERGIRGATEAEAAARRTAEAEAACRVLGARPVFANQIDGAADFTRARVDDVSRLLAAAAPDIVLTHWPLDTHFDHQVASLCAVRAAVSLARPPVIYFFEVNAGSQTWGFAPNVYVDISPVVEVKKRALFAHVSQDGEGIWRQHHEPMASFRGREARVAAAEAFVRLARGVAAAPLPEL